MRKLGYQVSRATIQRLRRLLHRRRVPPAPQRWQTSWRQFLRTPAQTVLACDFLHVDCAFTLTRVYVFFVIEVASRGVAAIFFGGTGVLRGVEDADGCVVDGADVGGVRKPRGMGSGGALLARCR